MRVRTVFIMSFKHDVINVVNYVFDVNNVVLISSFTMCMLSLKLLEIFVLLCCNSCYISFIIILLHS